jgi:Rrf2 family protein
MSEYYLEQLFAPLKKAGIIKSIRGAQGGYKLNHPAKEITAGEVMRVLEGSLTPVDCLENEDYECPSASCKTCNTKPLWEKLYAGVNEVLDTIYLSDLANESVI